jgi:hypothetical protein
MRRALFCTLALILVACFGALAQEGEAPGMPSPEEMAAWQKAMTPGEHHQHLAALEGSWVAKTMMWMDPAAPPTTSEGKAEWRMTMGGRYLVHKFKGEFMGTPFEGMGIVGYDNVLGKYVSTWMDTMGTGMLIETGSCDGEGKVFKSSGEYANAMTGEMEAMRSVHTIESADRNVLEMFGSGEDGKEFKMMEIVYTRKSE